MEGMKHSTFLSDRSPRGWPVPGQREPDPAGGLSLVLQMPAVVAATGLSRTTLWRLRRTGEFPNPVRLGGSTFRAVGWPYEGSRNCSNVPKPTPRRRSSLRWLPVDTSYNISKQQTLNTAQGALPTQVYWCVLGVSVTEF